jgi:hypothetical protein
MRTIGRDRNILIDHLQELNRSRAASSEIQKVIKDIGQSEEKAVEERSQFIEGLSDVLSIKQIAEFIVFERNFNKNLRELMRDVAKDRWNRRKDN